MQKSDFHELLLLTPKTNKTLILMRTSLSDNQLYYHKRFSNAKDASWLTPIWQCNVWLYEQKLRPTFFGYIKPDTLVLYNATADDAKVWYRDQTLELKLCLTERGLYYIPTTQLTEVLQ